MSGKLQNLSIFWFCTCHITHDNIFSYKHHWTLHICNSYYWLIIKILTIASDCHGYVMLRVRSVAVITSGLDLYKWNNICLKVPHIPLRTVHLRRQNNLLLNHIYLRTYVLWTWSTHSYPSDLCNLRKINKLPISIVSTMY